MMSPTRLTHLDRSNSAFVPTHQREPAGERALGGGSSSRGRVPISGAPNFQQRDELTFRYCRSDQHLGEVADADPAIAA